MTRKTLAAAVAALAIAPATASADQVTFGSDLAGTPDVMDNTHLADYLSFNVSSHNSHKSPVSGEILAVRVKGKIHPHQEPGREALNLFHTQVLRDNGNNNFTVDSSSQHLYFPVGGSENDVHTFVPSVQCVKAGQYVDFNHIGGWDGKGIGGTQYQIWQNDPSSVMNWYEHDNGTNIGSTWNANRQVNGNTGQEVVANPQHGRPYNGRELMMQIVVGTGFDGSNLCEGGLKGFEYDGVDIANQTFTVRDDGVAKARITCGSGRGFCEGVVRMSVDGTEIGTGNFKLNRSDTTNVDVPLTNEGARLVNSRGEVVVDVTVESRDEIGSPARNNGKTTLKSARPGGFPGTTIKPQSASVKQNTFFVRATCPAATAGACTGRLSIASQKRVALSRGSRGKVYKFGSGKFTIEPGKTARIPVKLSSSGKQVFRKVKKVVTIATVTTTDAAGGRVTKRHKVTLKRG